MRAKENRGALCLAALYLDLLEPTELEDAAHLLPLADRGEQRLHMLQVALPHDSHVVHLLGQENERKHKKVSALARAGRLDHPSDMLLLCQGLARALGTLAGGGTVDLERSTAERKRQKHRDLGFDTGHVLHTWLRLRPEAGTLTTAHRLQWRQDQRYCVPQTPQI